MSWYDQYSHSIHLSTKDRELLDCFSEEDFSSFIVENDRNIFAYRGTYNGKYSLLDAVKFLHKYLTEE